jgi:ATP-dependent DNA helicase RecG
MDTLEIIVDPYPYPVSYKGEYHYRSGSTKQELKGAAPDRFLLRKRGRHWTACQFPTSPWAIWTEMRWLTSENER